jgi:hypothetical protein
MIFDADRRPTSTRHADGRSLPLTEPPTSFQGESCMKRYRIWNRLVMTIVLGVVGGSERAWSNDPPKPLRPNILIIFTDDQG